MMGKSRYSGKPLLRLLELYVLKSIGELSEAEVRTLEKMAPKLHALYGGSGPWHEAVAAAIHMPPGLPDVIHEMWAKNRTITKTNDVEFPPQKFAEMFVDANFASMEK